MSRSTFGAKNLLPEEHETQDALPKDYSRFLFWPILAYFEATGNMKLNTYYLKT